MPTRRDVLRFSLASTLASLLPLRPAPASASTGDLVWLNRLTFGATTESLDHIASLGRAAWLDEQLALPADDADLTRRLAKARLRLAYEAGNDGPGRDWPARDALLPLASLGADPASLLPLVDWDKAMDYSERARPAEEVIAASLIRAVHAPAQLREVMTQFWHDHFNVHAQKNEFVSVFFPSYDAGLRDLAFGNFRDLLGHVATSPSMLVYLTNDESRASPANENFARELLELHTLGAGAYMNDRIRNWHDVPGATDGLALGYLDDDVYETARAFTGWTVGDGRWIADGETTPKTGRFAYVEAWHDPYQKRILGREFASHRAPMADGEEVLDMLATHPVTTRFICTKIARRFLSDDPDPALVDRLAKVFLDQSGARNQIAQVLRALTADPAFAAPPGKLRRPFEFLAAILRATGAEVAATEQDWVYQLSRAGWQQHQYPPPTGHPDRTEDWQTGNTLLRLVDIALYAQDDWFGLVKDRLSDRLPDGIATLGDLSAHWAGRLGGSAIAPEALAALGASPADALPEDPGERHGLSAMMVATAALSPEFLFR